MIVNITDDTKQHRFEMQIGNTIAFVNYKIEGDRYLLIHAEVPTELNGQGYGSKLAQGVYQTIKDKGARATPLCSFMVHYAKQHPEFQGLLEE